MPGCYAAQQIRLRTEASGGERTTGRTEGISPSPMLHEHAGEYVGALLEAEVHVRSSIHGDESCFGLSAQLGV